MIHLTATFHAQPGKEQQLKEVLTQALEPTRNEEGCVRIKSRSLSLEPHLLHTAKIYPPSRQHFHNLCSPSPH